VKKAGKTEVKAAPQALQDFTSCPDWGKGGEFVFDPVTKTRTRVGPDGQPVTNPAGDSTAAVTEKKGE